MQIRWGEILPPGFRGERERSVCKLQAETIKERPPLSHMQNIRVAATEKRELQCEVEGVKFIQFPSASGCPSVANDARTNRLWKKLSQREEEALTLLIVWGTLQYTHGYCLRGRRGRRDAGGHNRSKGPCPLAAF